MKKSDPRRGIGRPSKYDPRMVREAERLSVYFFSVNDFADFWGVSLETVHEWCAQHEDFARAMKRAFDFEKFCAAFDLEIESLSKQGLD